MDISVSEFRDRLTAKEKLNIVDVREELEFCTFNVGGLNIPLGKLTAEQIKWEKHNELVVLCQRGIRSKTACKLLRNMGFNNVRNLSGGLLALLRLNNQ